MLARDAERVQSTAALERSQVDTCDDDQKKRRVYKPRVVGDQVMTAADLERLHKYMVEIKGIKSSPSCAITLSRMRPRP